MGRKIGEVGLREATGVNIVAVWERGRLLPAKADIVLSQESVPVVVGTVEQMRQLDDYLVIYDTNYNPVLVIGGGKVGRATARALKQNGIAVHLVERNPAMRDRIGEIPDEVIIGDAADREVLMKAGLLDAPSVVLTTNDDAMNIYLAVYCRRLNPELRIISRITHERNNEAIYRAGADYAIGYASLGVEDVFSQIDSRELLILGEGFELFRILLPASLTGRTLADSKISSLSGLNVIGIQQDGNLVTNPSASTTLKKGSELLLVGSTSQRQAFARAFG